MLFALILHGCIMGDYTLDQTQMIKSMSVLYTCSVLSECSLQHFFNLIWTNEPLTSGYKLLFLYFYSSF